jgi:hypothetical protein
MTKAASITAGADRHAVRATNALAAVENDTAAVRPRNPLPLPLC